nr:hypothetical protein [uncultured Ottowia sp.]
MTLKKGANSRAQETRFALHALGRLAMKQGVNKVAKLMLRAASTRPAADSPQRAKKSAFAAKAVLRQLLQQRR